MLAFAGYLLLRAVIIAAPGYEYQLSLSNFVVNLISPYAVSLRDVIFQGLLSQNVVFIAAGLELALYLKTRNLSREFAVLGLAFIGLCIIALADGVGVNVGRVGGRCRPSAGRSSCLAVPGARRERGVQFDEVQSSFSVR